jgi:hypothetical protein
LRQLRLAKEAEDAAEKQVAKVIKAAGKGVFRKVACSFKRYLTLQGRSITTSL